MKNFETEETSKKIKKTKKEMKQKLWSDDNGNRDVED